METWTKLHLSLWGRVSVVKMNILLKMIFLFQTRPILGEMNCFKEWKREISRFIWSGKKPRIKHQLLTDQKERGGFALPDLEFYHAAAGLVWIKDWITLKDTDLLDLEGHENRSGWHASLMYGKVKVHRGFLSHVIRKS